MKLSGKEWAGAAGWGAGSLAGAAGVIVPEVVVVVVSRVGLRSGEGSTWWDTFAEKLDHGRASEEEAGWVHDGGGERVR